MTFSIYFYYSETIAYDVTYVCGILVNIQMKYNQK